MFGITPLTKLYEFYAGVTGKLPNVTEQKSDFTATFEKKILLEPYKHIAEAKGKAFRSKFGLAFNHWLQISSENFLLITEKANVVHNVSLLCDDIEDHSELRRGLPVAHHIYGVEMTIHCALYVYLKWQKKTPQLYHPDMFKVFTEHGLILAKGQLMDIYWRDFCVCPTEEDYKKMVLNKSGGLFRLVISVMQLFSECKTDFVPLLNDIGLYYQIRDDYANLCTQEYTDTKGFAEDLSEGKFSFPAVYGIKLKPENNIIISTLKEKPTCNKIKKRCIDYMESIGCFSYTRSVLKDLEYKILQQISELGGNPDLEDLILSLNIDHLQAINTFSPNDE